MLAGCAETGVLVPAGAYGKAPGFALTVRRSWSDITYLLPGRPPNVRQLSIDGPLLNRLLLAGLDPGQGLVKPADKNTPRPIFRDDMTDSELVEFVIDSLAAMEYQSPESASLRPQTLGGAPGVRFDISARTADGLNISGTALVARADKKLHVLIFLAPSEHYYPALLPDVEAAFTSAA
jgi:hypothetical protein